MISCPIKHCSHPLYDSNWKKDRSCLVWQLDDESRFEYYDDIEAAKSAKYKAKIKFYLEEEQQTERRLATSETIKHGKFFFTDVIIPLNNKIELDTTSLTEEDIFEEDYYEYEEFDEDYFYFNQFEEDNVNLESATIMNRALHNFELQKSQHSKTALSTHFFFDSKSEDLDDTLCNLFKQADFQEHQVQQIHDNIIRKHNLTLDRYQLAVEEMQRKISSVTNSDAYNIYIDQFLELYPDYLNPESYYKYNDEVPYQHHQYIEELFKFKHEHKTYKIPKNKTKFKLVYLTSGGGKTTLSRTNSLYLDIDHFIARHYDKFKIVESFCIKFKDYQLMSLFFKHSFFYDIDYLQGRIILLNHPNQVPNQFRLGTNEIVLIPQQLNWDIRFFNENYFSLLAIQGKIKYFSDYDNYGKIIFNHFIKCKEKKFLLQ